MAPEVDLMERAKTLLAQRGRKAVEISRQQVLKQHIEYEPLREALRYFVEEIWFDFLHPALISLSCEAVGGKPEDSINIGASMVLLAGAADIHDDIIDKSLVKQPKPTIFGKFGQDIAILAGDALLLQGLYLMHEACRLLPEKKKEAILDCIKQAFFEISSAEAEEAGFRGNLDLKGSDYLEIIRKKVAAAEATMKIGAISRQCNFARDQLAGELWSHLRNSADNKR